MADITQILSQMNHGDTESTEKLFALLYNELRRLAKHQMASQPPGHTLQATALVHEAFVRLLGSDSSWENRVHFFSTAAEAMRRILVEHVRSKKSQKRGGNLERVELCEANALLVHPLADELLDLHEAIDKLEKISPQQAQLIKLRFFGGVNMPQVAELLNISLRTAQRDWTFARAWLSRWIKQSS